MMCQKQTGMVPPGPENQASSRDLGDNSTIRRSRVSRKTVTSVFQEEGARFKICYNHLLDLKATGQRMKKSCVRTLFTPTHPKS